MPVQDISVGIIEGADRNTYLRNSIEPRHTGQLLDGLDLSDETDDTDRDSPEDNENTNDSKDKITTNKQLPPGNSQTLPDNFLRLDTNVAGRHVKSVVMSSGLVGGLGIRLCVKLNKDGGGLLHVASEPISLSGVGFGNKSLEFLASPFNSVNLLADKTQRSQSMARALLGSNPAVGDASGFGVGLGRGSLLSILTRLLDGLGTLLVNKLQKLDFTLLQLHGNVITFLDKFIHVLGVANQPNILDGFVEELADASLVEILVRHRGEENGSGRHALRVLG